jgi:hypothetical protein
VPHSAADENSLGHGWVYKDDGEDVGYWAKYLTALLAALYALLSDNSYPSPTIKRPFFNSHRYTTLPSKLRFVGVITSRWFPTSILILLSQSSRFGFLVAKVPLLLPVF